MDRAHQMGMIRLPPPNKIGFRGYSSWREHQEESILFLSDSTKRFPVLCQPVGAGKSLTIAAYLKLNGLNAMYLTATKTLQKQVSTEFAELGWADVRGQNNYDCVVDPPYKVDMGPCHEGIHCPGIKEEWCTYWGAVRKAERAQYRISNYAWWLHNQFPMIDALVCDEAHNLIEQLSEFLSAQFTPEHITRFFHNDHPPVKGGWAHWAARRTRELEEDTKQLKAQARVHKKHRKDLRTARALMLKLLRLGVAKESDWVVERVRTPRGTYNYRFDPVWPAPYRELLFREIPKVVLVSATIRPKHLEIMGIKEEEYDFHETPSTFPVSRRPVYCLPSVRLSYRSTPSELKVWQARMDAIPAGRHDRKGLIHAVAYHRRNFILGNSRHRDRYVTHESGQQEPALERWCSLPESSGAIFLSPSATTGLNLIGPLCRFIIWAKVPFPDRRSLILKARAKIDPEYPMLMAAVDIDQGTGRGMRAPWDWCETFINDDMFRWFVNKYRRFFTAGFLAAWDRYKHVRHMPPAPDLKKMALDVKRLTGKGK